MTGTPLDLTPFGALAKGIGVSHHAETMAKAVY